jgi:recombination protein RecT
MGLDEINAIRKRSRSGNSGPWVTDFAEMSKKTVVRRHSKRLPMSTDLDGVLREDDDLFMPPPVEQQAAPEPAPTKRPSRLDKVAQQAPTIDEDGVIDMPMDEPPMDGHADESPI